MGFDLPKSSAEAIPLVDVIRQATSEPLAAHAATIRCEQDIDPGILVRDVPEQVGELVRILVRQALQEMPAGGELTLTAWSDGERVELEIADTGRPIAERPHCLPLVAAVVGAEMCWQDCPQGGAAVTIFFGRRLAQHSAA